MLEMLERLARKGWRTSEFWIVVLALVFPLLDAAVVRAVGWLDAQHTVWTAMAAAAVSAAFSVGRGVFKGRTAAALIAAGTLTPPGLRIRPEAAGDLQRRLAELRMSPTPASSPAAPLGGLPTIDDTR